MIVDVTAAEEAVRNLGGTYTINNQASQDGTSITFQSTVASGSRTYKQFDSVYVLEPIFIWAPNRVI